VNYPSGYSVRFSDDGEMLVCLGRNVVVIDVAARQRLSTGHPFSHPSNACFSPDGGTLAVKSTSGRIVIIEPRSGEVLFDHRNQKDGEGGEVQFSPEGDMLVEGSWGGVLTVRQAMDATIQSREQFPGEMIRRVTHDEARLNWLFEHSRKFRPGETSRPRSHAVLRNWPFRPGDERKITFGFDVANTTLSPDGQSICVIEKPIARLHVARVADGAVVSSSEPFDHGGTGNEIAWSTDGRHIASVQARKFVFYRASDLAVEGEVVSQYPSSISFRAGAQEVALGSWNTSAIVPLSAVWRGGMALK
jgi:WD40 repeat protein